MIITGLPNKDSPKINSTDILSNNANYITFSCRSLGHQPFMNHCCTVSNSLARAHNYCTQPHLHCKEISSHSINSCSCSSTVSRLCYETISRDWRWGHSIWGRKESCGAVCWKWRPGKAVDRRHRGDVVVLSKHILLFAALHGFVDMEEKARKAWGEVLNELIWHMPQWCLHFFRQLPVVMFLKFEKKLWRNQQSTSLSPKNILRQLVTCFICIKWMVEWVVTILKLPAKVQQKV